MTNSPLRPVRNAMAILAAVAAVTAGLAPAASAAPAAPTAVLAPASATFNPVAAADLGLSRVGQHGGQCKQWMNDVFAQASNGEVALGGGYYSDYAREGGGHVDSSGAWKGDVIQLNNPADRDGYYNGMHTAIVVSNLGGGNFDVVDSNFDLDEVVTHHTWNPYTSASRNGLEVNIWRF